MERTLTRKLPKKQIRRCRELPWGLGVFAQADRDTIVYKKVVIGETDYKVPRYYDCTAIYRYGVAKLLIPKGTAVYLTSTKCRASKAKVLEIKALGRSTTYPEAVSMHHDKFKYKVGATVNARKGLSRKFQQCESGIHFFRTLKEARAY